ncbi:hypothetical protein [Pseudothermotoga thermarum]|uniref:hypothetical protein n=1 Tax=Pseudothermotoga thermarum TaxID=119394 RepID=UPI001B7FB67F|nr:hypothetical protein [Pseudothermotoga thermarum]
MAFYFKSWLFVIVYAVLCLFLTKKDLLSFILSFVMFPILPLIYGLSKKNWKPKYKETPDFELPSAGVKVSYDKLDVVPIDLIMKYGSIEQKKKAIETVYKMVEELRLEADRAAAILYTFLMNETSQDIVLYCTEYLEQIESFLISQIGRYSKLVHTKDGLFNFALYSYQYSKTPFLIDEQKIEILRFVREKLEQSPNEFFDKNLADLYLRILVDLGEKEVFEQKFKSFENLYTNAEKAVLLSYARKIFAWGEKDGKTTRDNET